MILGFGKTEEDTARNIINGCIKAALRANNEGDIGHAVDEVEVVYHSKADTYDKMDRESCPERYTRFWAHIIETPSYNILAFTMHHINRRHGLSPDGWALFVTKWMATISTGDNEITIYKEA